MSIPKTGDLFDTGHTIAGELFEKTPYPWQILNELGEYIKELSKGLGGGFREIDDGIFVSREAKIDKSATLTAPLIVCSGAQIRAGAFIRGSVIVGCGVVVGNSSEVKNSVLFDEAKLPHYNYLGDSIIGFRAHMGAGAVASNLRLDKRKILIRSGDESVETGMKKLGAMIGDYTEIGCGAVISPGAVIGRECMIYPLTHVYGVLPERSRIGGREKRE